jgi:hypothetical protein
MLNSFFPTQLFHPLKELPENPLQPKIFFIICGIRRRTPAETALRASLPSMIPANLSMTAFPRQ